MGLLEVKKIDDCKEGDLIDWGGTSDRGMLLYLWGAPHRPCQNTIKYGWAPCAGMLSIPT